MSNEKEIEINSIIESFGAPEWTLSQEREFMENLFVGRFNYFLVVFSLFMTAGFANRFDHYKYIVFYAGAFVLFLIWLVLYRGYKKHDRILRIIFQKRPDHPTHKIEKIMELEGYKPKYKGSKLMGVYIPWLCILFLLTIAIAVQLKLLT